jgi:hypothetical protein
VPTRARRVAGALIVFAAGVLLMALLQQWARPFAPEGTYFQQHSSEDMMQTLSLLDLREHAVESLLVLHIQPPLLDALRAALARLWPEAGPRPLVRRVDRALYALWTVVYAGMGALVYVWLERLTGSAWIAGPASLAFLLHPAAICYATLLEGTLLTSFGILWLSYALWRLPPRGDTPSHAERSAPATGVTLSLAVAYVFLFFVRSIFQWPALVVLLAALVLRRAPRRSMLAICVACGAVVGLYMLKQYLVLGTTSTSSFSGSSCLQALGEVPAMGLTSPADTPLGPLYPRLFPAAPPPALTRETKIRGAHNFNHLADLRNERSLAARCRERLITDPPRRTLAAWAENVSIFLEPSSRYLTPHVIVDRLPWRGVYEWPFSGPRLVLLLAAALFAWSRGRTRNELLGGLGLALPVLFVSAVCVVFERDENMRYKFFVEPVLYVFLVAQGTALARAWVRKTPAQAGATAEPAP